MKHFRFNNLYIFFLIIIILLISIIPYIFFRSNNNNLYITVNGIDVTNQYINKDDMSDENDNKKIITIETEYGINKIEISSHAARCIYSNCKNQICVQTGFIDKQFDNQMIICSPHRLVVGFK